MKIISGKTVFASLVFLLIMSFVINTFLNEDDFVSDKNKYNRSSENQDKIIGVEIRQQNKQGDKFLIIADTLEEIESKEKKVILENSLTTIDQKGVLTKISAGNAMKLPIGSFLIALITSGTLLYVGIVLVTKYADTSSKFPSSLNCFTKASF